jgi:hypothetical protein
LIKLGGIPFPETAWSADLSDVLAEAARAMKPIYQEPSEPELALEPTASRSNAGQTISRDIHETVVPYTIELSQKSDSKAEFEFEVMNRLVNPKTASGLAKELISAQKMKSGKKSKQHLNEVLESLVVRDVIISEPKGRLTRFTMKNQERLDLKG